MKVELNLKRLTWILLTNGILFARIWQWIHSLQPITHHLDHYALDQTPNFTLYELQYRQYDVNGTVTHFLEAPKLHHIPKNDMHIFNHPHVVVTQLNQASMDIHADFATAMSKGQTITLDQHVQINQRKDAQETVLKTEHLTYYPQEKKAMTSDQVSITQGTNQIHAGGLVADLAENHLHLVQARGKHVRSPA